MTAIRIRTVLSSTTLDLPELAPLVGHSVELIVQDDAAPGWPEGWFEAVEGAIADPTFARPAQPDIQSRQPLEP
ncbi:MAG TPA: hypothetical protein VJN18_18055 [Polyangiaceae bacterium]|nr:hypothetical protein [Polyangiaceae bacterium]